MVEIVYLIVWVFIIIYAILFTMNKLEFCFCKVRIGFNFLQINDRLIFIKIISGNRKVYSSINEKHALTLV